ncbi:MAG: DUF3592 domain-containing protein [Bacilli bacterium]|nr:DUF3592 domain-containing protein [Bacilli bacterium]
MRESQTARFFIPAGLILIIFGIVVFVITLNNQNYIKIEATVANVEETQETNVDDGETNITTIYNATVNYIVDGKEYTQTLDNVSKCKVGDKMDIYYNPKDPNQITQTKSLILPSVIIFAGIASLVGGIISAVNAVKRHKKMKEQERSWANE